MAAVQLCQIEPASPTSTFYPPHPAQALEEYKEATASLKDSFTIRVLLLGHDNTFVANTYCQLAHLYIKQGLKDRAVEQLRAMMGVGAKLGWSDTRWPDGIPKVSERQRFLASCQCLEEGPGGQGVTNGSSVFRSGARGHILPL